jgi:hypothetical protein
MKTFKWGTKWQDELTVMGEVVRETKKYLFINPSSNIVISELHTDGERVTRSSGPCEQVRIPKTWLLEVK